MRASLRNSSGKGSRPGRRRSDTDDEDDKRHRSRESTLTGENLTTPDLSEEEMDSAPDPPPIEDDAALHVHNVGDETGFIVQERKSSKRHREKTASSPTSPATNTKKSKAPPQDFAIPTKNSFDVLPIDDPMEHPSMATSATKKTTLYKPPPLVVYHTRNYLELNKALKAEISGSLRAIYKGDHVKYHFDNMEDYKKANAFLRANQLHFFTHQPPDERLLKVVVHGMPEVVPTPDIQSDLTSLGYEVRNIHRYSKRDPSTKKLIPQPTFTVSLPKEKQSEKIYNERYILNTRVRIENYESKDGPPQCKNCQRLRHTAKYCHLPPRCVKCAGPHTTAQCCLKHTDKPTCALCGTEGHPASWRGCPEYQKALRSYGYAASRQRHPPPRQRVPTATSADFPALGTTMVGSARRSYAAVAAPRGEDTTEQATDTTFSDSMKEITTFLSSLFRGDTITKLKSIATKIKNAPDTMGKLMALVEGFVTFFA